MEYIIITPARNEQNYIRYIIDSVTKQTLKPKQWIIVDDGSTDNTKSIVKSYAEDYPWVKIINSGNILDRSEGGAKVVKAFYAGFEYIKYEEYDFIVKLDADLTLPFNYFEMVAECFENFPDVGMCGGVCSININGKLQQEYSANYHLRGPLKAYRRECFDQIGGLRPVYMWDHLDEMKAMQMGWEIKILPLIVIHHRPTSTNINRGVKNSFKAGSEYYRIGYDLLLSLIKSISFGIGNKPRFVAGFFFLFGYLYAMVTRESISIENELREYMVNFQYQRIKDLFQSVLKSKTASKV